MRRPRGTAIVGIPALVAVGFVLGSCGGADDCLALPCALPVAFTISVTARSGGPVQNVGVTVSGAATGAAECSVGDVATTCTMEGTAGTYVVTIEAPGFVRDSETIVVDGATPTCGCPNVIAKHLDVVLRPWGQARDRGLNR